MDTPTLDLERITTLLRQAREALGDGRLADAEAAAHQAAALDPKNPRAEDILSEVYRARGEEESARRHDDAAKRLRQEAWQREVEAEARGQHEWMGEAVRHTHG